MSEYLARLQAPVRRLDPPRNGKRPSTTQRVESNALRVAALVAARVACDCAATLERNEAEAERLDDKRVEGILLRFETVLDREEDARAERELRAFKRKLDRTHREPRKARHLGHRLTQQDALQDRATAHREYLARCARRERLRQREASLEYEAWPYGTPLTQPGPAVQVGPATQPSRDSRASQPGISRISQPISRSRAVLTFSIAPKVAAALAATPTEPNADSHYSLEDYTSPVRGEGSLSSLEERHMIRAEMDCYDDAQGAELAWYDRGFNCVNRPTHAVLAAQAACTCGPDFEIKPTFEELCRPSDVVIAEGCVRSNPASIALLDEGTPAQPTAEHRTFGNTTLPSVGGVVLF